MAIIEIDDSQLPDFIEEVKERIQSCNNKVSNYESLINDNLSSIEKAEADLQKFIEKTEGIISNLEDANVDLEVKKAYYANEAAMMEDSLNMGQEEEK